MCKIVIFRLICVNMDTWLKTATPIDWPVKKIEYTQSSEYKINCTAFHRSSSFTVSIDK